MKTLEFKLCVAIAAELEQFQRASAEVDRELIRLSRARAPLERLRVATRAQKALAKFRPSRA